LTKTVLVVDDEAIVRLQMREIFEERGYAVLEGADGSAGLEIFQRHQEEISLVVLDLHMPELSGYELLAELQIIDPDVPIVVITGYTPDEERLPGIRAILRKPFNPKALLGLLSTLEEE
jgi:CheY-like chemotaxis protein